MTYNVFGGTLNLAQPTQSKEQRWRLRGYEKGHSCT